ncbi:hypothetical protein [Streptomyces sp. NPDC058307]
MTLGAFAELMMGLDPTGDAAALEIGGNLSGSGGNLSGPGGD